jgi:hypothetical protein
MPSLYALPVIALSLVGAAAGLSLGRAAIEEVNPVYLHDPDQAFHADLAPYRSPDWAAVQAQEYQQAQVVTEPAPTPATCIGCRTWPVEYVPRHDPTIDRAYAPRADDREYREALARLPAEAVPEPARERIVRYTSYPVSREEAAARRLAAAQARAEAGAEALAEGGAEAPLEGGAEDHAATQ